MPLHGRDCRQLFDVAVAAAACAAVPAGQPWQQLALLCSVPHPHRRAMSQAALGVAHNPVVRPARSSGRWQPASSPQPAPRMLLGSWLIARRSLRLLASPRPVAKSPNGGWGHLCSLASLESHERRLLDAWNNRLGMRAASRAAGWRQRRRAAPPVLLDRPTAPLLPQATRCRSACTPSCRPPSPRDGGS